MIQEEIKNGKVNSLLDNCVPSLDIQAREDKKQQEIIRLMPEIKKRSALVSENESSFEAGIFCQGFVEGAEWRINSVWHRTDNGQAPEEGRLCLLEVESYEEDGERYVDHVSSQWGHFGWTDDFLKIIKRRSEGRYKIIRWAYIEDLLSIKED